MNADETALDRWMEDESWYGYPRGYWLAYGLYATLVALLFVWAVNQGEPAGYIFPALAAYGLGWGHGAVMAVPGVGGR